MVPQRTELDFEELIAHTVDVLTILDDEEVIQYQSPSIESVLGYDPDELVGDNVLEYVHPDDRQMVLENFREFVEADVEYASEGIEFRFRHEDGSWVWIEVRGRNQSESSLDGYVVSSRNISARKEYEQQLKRERDRLDRFASVVSHDLRNPLNVLQGQLELAREDCESEHFAAMERSLDRMNELIDDVLTFSRESEAEPLVDAVNVQNMSETCWQNLDTKAATLSIETEQTIVADENQFKQVLENLFRNSIEHGGDDVLITIGAIDDGFYVADDGPGLPEDVRDSILEFGFSTKTDGTGFGLSIVNKITENHGWDLTVVDGQEGGVRFEFRDVASA